MNVQNFILNLPFFHWININSDVFIGYLKITKQ